MDLLKDRVWEIIQKFENGNQKRFATKIGVSPGLVNNWKSGHAAPKEENRRLICRTYPVNREWLDTGEGDMEVQQTDSGTQLANDSLAAELHRLEGENRLLKEQLREQREELERVRMTAIEAAIDKMLTKYFEAKASREQQAEKLPEEPIHQSAGD